MKTCQIIIQLTSAICLLMGLVWLSPPAIGDVALVSSVTSCSKPDLKCADFSVVDLPIPSTSVVKPASAYKSASTDDEFLKGATANAMNMIALSQFALNRAENKEVKAIAQSLIEDYISLLGQLRSVAKDNG